MKFPPASQKRSRSRLFSLDSLSRSSFRHGEESRDDQTDVDGGGKKFSARTIVWGFTLAAVALMVFGSKILLIAAYGSIIPFWDQWGGEAAGLYIPYLKGELPFASCSLPITSTES